MTNFNRIVWRVVLPWCIGLSVLALLVLPSEYSLYNPLILALWGVNRVIFYVLVNPIPEEARFWVFLGGTIVLGYALSYYNNRPIPRIPEKWHFKVWVAGLITCLILFMQLYHQGKLATVKPWQLQRVTFNAGADPDNPAPTDTIKRYPGKKACESAAFALQSQARLGEVYGCVYDEESMAEEHTDVD